jgi:5'-3' exonuclease
MHLLPPPYAGIAQGSLAEFFPNDFACDLNGKTLSYEAIVLIPFADEIQVLAEEVKLFN